MTKLSEKIAKNLADAPQDMPVPFDVISNAFDTLKDADEAELAILALVLTGFSMRAVAKLFNLDVSTVHYHVSKLDPDKTLRLTLDQRNSIMACVFMHKASDALARISGAKLDKLSADKLMKLASDALAVSKALESKSGPQADGNPLATLRAKG